MNLKILQELIPILREAQYVTVLTGAGTSAESGIPTFREAQTGLWSKYDPEELATPQAFRANPELVLGWYRWRQEIISNAEPNSGHIALARMELILTHHDLDFSLITQNVDGLHQRAGSHNIIELHGNLNRSKCTDCGAILEDDHHTYNSGSHCVKCGGYLRPDVVWFGENLPSFALQVSWEAAQTCDIFFSIGTSTMVQPAASLPILALQKGAILVEINPNDTPITNHATYSLQGPSGGILPQLVNMVWPN